MLRHVLLIRLPPYLFVRQINDVEKGYYADGEDAYDMRLSFQRDDSSEIKGMTPLKQLVAIKRVATRNEDQPKSESSTDGGGKAIESSSEAGGAREDNTTSSSAEDIATKMEKLSVKERSA